MDETPDDATCPPVPTVEVGALLPRLDRGDTVLVLDVRNREEFDAWRIEARRPVETVHVPYFDFIEDPAASIAQVPRGRDVVVLCAQGGSSEMVAAMLQEAGVRSANVEGGMIAYGVYLEPVRVPLAGSEHQEFVDARLLRHARAGLLAYQLVQANGQIPFGRVRVAADQFLCDHQSQHAIAEEFQPLI